MENIVLECENLYKKIKKKTILKNISLQVRKGEIVGFIGPNGAGKTTTIKLILGLQKITKGNVKINGFSIKDDFVKAIEKVGAIVESPDLYMYMTGYDNLKIAKEYYKDIPDSRIDAVIRIVGLEKRIYDKVSSYSLGMRQRLGIAQAILHGPNLLILDEPTNGLDPEGIIEIRKLLKYLAYTQNISILISSHNLSELENVCNKVCIIKNGEIIEETNIENLKQENMQESYIFEVNNIKVAQEILKNISERIDNSHLRVFIHKEKLPSVNKVLEKNNVSVFTVEKEDITLEEAFLKKIGGNTID